MIRKLPYKLRDKWRPSACDIQESCGAVFVDIVTLIEHQVKITVDPVCGDIQDAPMLVVVFYAQWDKRKWLTATLHLIWKLLTVQRCLL